MARKSNHRSPVDGKTGDEEPRYIQMEIVEESEMDNGLSQGKVAESREAEGEEV